MGKSSSAFAGGKEVIPQLPDPYQVLHALKKAIQQNQRPTILLHAFLTSGSATANIIGNLLFSNKAAMQLLTSPEGRKYIHLWLDDTLDYLQKFAEQP